MQAFNRELNRFVGALSGIFESIMESSRMIAFDRFCQASWIPGKSSS